MPTRVPVAPVPKAIPVGSKSAAAQPKNQFLNLHGLLKHVQAKHGQAGLLPCESPRADFAARCEVPLRAHTNRESVCPIISHRAGR